jgi:hypothetical protein
MKNQDRSCRVRQRRLTNITLITLKVLLIPIKWKKKIAKFL